MIQCEYCPKGFIETANGLAEKPKKFEGNINESIKLIKEYNYGAKNE